MTITERGVQRVRHKLKMRLLTVGAVTHISPLMVRVTVTGDELSDFASAAYDDHCKLFFLDDHTSGLPVPGDNGLVWPEGQRPPGRDYTPRAFDTAAKTLDLDFVLHGDGPASTWAAQVQPGDKLGVGGPRGSFVVSGDFDYYLLVGDETALPAIGRRIEELPAGAKVIALIEISDDAERQNFTTSADLDLLWLSRNGAPAGTTTLLADAVAALTLPNGVGYCFAAGESAMSKAVRANLVDVRGLNPDYVKAAGYWHLQAADFDDGHAH